MAVAAALALASVGMAGCGQSQQERYCAALSADRTRLVAMGGTGSPTALFAALPMLRSLAAQAPPAVGNDWAILVRAVTGLSTALRAAHVPASAFRHGHPPAGLTPARRTRIAAAAGVLTTRGVLGATTAIQRHAVDVCHVDLGS